MASQADVLAALRRHVEGEVVRVTVNAHGELREATPVDTGFASSNWQITIGAPATGTVGIGASVGELVGYTLDQGSTFVTNNAEYIQRLNAGSSTQAPAGFVEQAVARAATP